ncbi:hypothetical protein BC829DRAFT_489035 [Chytridium lagenaria]|nr:hypothetical protein BC829DRAFT_489035 [Chytridium lagenaria]
MRILTLLALFLWASPLALCQELSTSKENLNLDKRLYAPPNLPLIPLASSQLQYHSPLPKKILPFPLISFDAPTPRAEVASLPPPPRTVVLEPKTSGAAQWEAKKSTTKVRRPPPVLTKEQLRAKAETEQQKRNTATTRQAANAAAYEARTGKTGSKWHRKVNSEKDRQTKASIAAGEIDVAKPSGPLKEAMRTDPSIYVGSADGAREPNVRVLAHGRLVPVDLKHRPDRQLTAGQVETHKGVSYINKERQLESKLTGLTDRSRRPDKLKKDEADIAVLQKA